MGKKVRIAKIVFNLFVISCALLWSEPSETACSAKCGKGNSIFNDKITLQKRYEDLEITLFDHKDDWLDKLKTYFLNEEDHPSDEYQTHFQEMVEKWQEDIDSVDFEKIKSDSKIILQEAEEWVRGLDLTELRKDGEAQVDFYRQYIEDYRSIKDDFINGNIGDFLETYLGDVDVDKILKKKKDGQSTHGENLTVKTDGVKQVTGRKKRNARMKALVNECKTRFKEIKEERQADYEDLKEKYREVHEDLKNKKRHWKKLQKTWRPHDNDEDDENDGDR